MDDVLNKLQGRFIEMADADNVLLNHIVDHLIAKKCLQDQQKEVIKNRETANQRALTLLSFVRQGLPSAFHELCNALDSFRTAAAASFAEEFRNEHNTELTEQLRRLEEKVTLSNNAFNGLGKPKKMLKRFHSIDNGGIAVWAIALLDEELYVRFKETDIKVYDTTTSEFRFKCNVTIASLGGISDLASSTADKCVYVADFKKSVVHKLVQRGVTIVWQVNDQPFGLSVNSKSHVLVTCDKVRKIKEFSSSGFLLHEINLQEDIVHPWQAAELSEGTIVVCHGDKDDPQHRICVVNSFGTVLFSHGSKKGPREQQLNLPIRLTVHNHHTLLCDDGNQRLLMFSPTLKERYQIRTDEPLRHPFRIVYDEKSQQLYVAENEWKNGEYIKGCVKVFKIC